MTPESIRALEKRLENLTLEVKAIDVLVQHAIADLRRGGEAHVAAAAKLLDAILHTTELYR